MESTFARKTTSGRNPPTRIVDIQLSVLFSANQVVEFTVCSWILTILSYILVAFTLPLSACLCIKVVQEYERAVIFRLGRLMPGGARGPGKYFFYSAVYRLIQENRSSSCLILSKDSVTVAVDAVVYFRISNATISVTNVEDASRSTKLLAQTTLRNILGTRTLAEMLSDREAISHQMQCTLDEATDPWGVKVERVEVKDVRLPLQLQRAMAAEAEATREAGAKVIAAEGEQKASQALREAAEVTILFKIGPSIVNFCEGVECYISCIILAIRYNIVGYNKLTKATNIFAAIELKIIAYVDDV
ncbi:SPFH/Band 7/PHB domain protein [Dictyocaulus viviparus]|uniref:SPFH/Band 7/PHB domain protein n=1 Tax=Dictyocaulus viviparus TaxID=29172 RepID=A0A0D8XUL4_DICVI|nr:SPFH/Band 7/PHB domain protein [Dictyocaulus viviparus]